jgi:hypothetical protein
MLRRQHRRSRPETTGGKRKSLAIFALEQLTLGMPTAPPAAAPPARSARHADVLAPSPASAGDQASAKGERLRGAVIGSMGAPADDQTGNLEDCSRSGGQRHRFRTKHRLSGKPAQRQASAGIGIHVVAATTAIAVARRMMSAISRDGHRRRHHAALDEGQAHPEPQQNRQEQNARPMPGPAFHGASKMALLDANGKSL